MPIANSPSHGGRFSEFHSRACRIFLSVSGVSGPTRRASVLSATPSAAASLRRRSHPTGGRAARGLSSLHQLTNEEVWKRRPGATSAVLYSCRSHDGSDRRCLTPKPSYADRLGGHSVTDPRVCDGRDV